MLSLKNEIKHKGSKNKKNRKVQHVVLNKQKTTVISKHHEFMYRYMTGKSNYKESCAV